MAQHGKKYRQAREQVDEKKLCSLQEGIELVKKLAHAKFDESIDIDINLSIDPSKADQLVRGSVVLPYGIGKRAKVVVFAKGEYAERALKAGADYVGAEDLIEKIENGWVDFDYSVATPDLMTMVGRVAKILGPRQKLPNKKQGTVSFDVDEVVLDLKKGRQFFKNDKAGIVHVSIGRVSFDATKLYENLTVFIKALAASKPPSAKGKFIKRITISSTMGPGVHVNPD